MSLDVNKPGYITIDARERAKRGPQAAGCLSSTRWLRFGRSWDGPRGQRFVSIEVITDTYDKEGQRTGERKLTGLHLQVEDLKMIVERFDEEARDDAED